jgi:hypothetical protein
VQNLVEIKTELQRETKPASYMSLRSHVSCSGMKAERNRSTSFRAQVLCWPGGWSATVRRLDDLLPSRLETKKKCTLRGGM